MYPRGVGTKALPLSLSGPAYPWCPSVADFPAPEVVPGEAEPAAARPLVPELVRREVAEAERGVPRLSAPELAAEPAAARPSVPELVQPEVAAVERAVPRLSAPELVRMAELDEARYVARNAAPVALQAQFGLAAEQFGFVR